MGLNTTYWKFGIITLILFGIVGFQLLDFKETDIESAVPTSPTAPAPLAVQVDNTPLQPVTQRVGINMSYWTPWGSAQYMRNVLMNPGLEAGQIDRVTVIVQRKDQNSFSDGENLGMPDNYWVDATFDVRSGQSIGAKGTITRSLNAGADGLPQYFPDELPPLAVNDVIIVTKTTFPDPVPQWWIPDSSTSLTKLSRTPRPDSSGQWSVALSPNQNGAAELNFYFDAIAEKAGILRPINKPWELRFWAKADQEGASLDINFSRTNGSSPFFAQNVAPSTSWQEYTFPINANDNGPAATVQLNFIASTAGTTIYLDDVQLGPIQSDNPLTVWNQDVIDMLKKLRPSWLRDWQGQLGDTFSNRIADPFSRINYTFRTYGGPGSLQYSYSIPEFLELCSQVQANPWLIVPTTLSDEEFTEFGKFLAEHCDQSRFSQVVVEFGNENWNWLFRSNGIPIYESHGAVADHAFQLISATAGPNVNMRKVINGQYANPWVTQQFLTTASNYDTMSIAPYFFFDMQKGSTSSDNLKTLFAPDTGQLQENLSHTEQANKALSVYEINLHTMGGSATPEERLPIVAGAASGAALAQALMKDMFVNASPQVVFCLAQFDAPAFDVPGFIRLWGICRDISGTKRLRPTGLAVEMLNQIIGGSLHAIKPSGGTTTVPPATANLTMAAFRTDSTWAAALVSANATATEVAVAFPDDGRALPTYANTLSASSPLDTNEESENVKIIKAEIQTDQRTITCSVPPYGLVVLTNETVQGATPVPSLMSPPEPESTPTPAPAPTPTPTSTPSSTPSLAPTETPDPTSPERKKRKKKRRRQQTSQIEEERSSESA